MDILCVDEYTGLHVITSKQGKTLESQLLNCKSESAAEENEDLGVSYR